MQRLFALLRGAPTNSQQSPVYSKLVGVRTAFVQDKFSAKLCVFNIEFWEKWWMNCVIFTIFLTCKSYFPRAIIFKYIIMIENALGRLSIFPNSDKAKERRKSWLIWWLFHRPKNVNWSVLFSFVAIYRIGRISNRYHATYLISISDTRYDSLGRSMTG